MSEIIVGNANTIGVKRNFDSRDFYDLYKAVNEKSEEISKDYEDDLLIEFSDIQNIHLKIMQSLHSFHCQPESVHTRFVLFHNNDESEKFNSFEKFETHNSTNPYATTELVMIYQFLLKPSSTNQPPEKYKIEVKLRSRLARYDEIVENGHVFLLSMLSSSKSAGIEIEYTDYIKAKSFISTFDEWIKACRKTNVTLPMKKIVRYSHWIPQIGMSALLAFVIYQAFIMAKTPANSQMDIRVFMVVFLGSLVMLSTIGKFFLSKIEQLIDSYLVMSYINLNSGDKNLIDKYSGRNRRSFGLMTLNLLITVSLGVFINYIYDHIKNYLN